MKKITAVLLAMLFLLPLAACKNLIPVPGTEKVTVAPEQTESETETETKTEPETETDAVTDDDTGKYYDLCKAAYEKTAAERDFCYTNTEEWRIVAEYVGLTRKVNETSKVTEVKHSGSDGMIELHQSARSSTSGVETTSSVDVFAAGDEIIYKRDTDRNFAKAKKDSAEVSAFAALITDTVSQDIDAMKFEFKTAQYTENGDGTRTVTAKFDNEEITAYSNDAIGDFKKSFEEGGATDVKAEVTSFTLTSTISKDGYITAVDAELDFSITMKAEGFDIKAEAKSKTKIEYSNIGQKIEIVLPFVPEKYELYSAFLSADSEEPTLVLYGDGTFEISFYSVNDNAGFPVRTEVLYIGDYKETDGPTRISVEEKRIVLKTVFENTANKNAYKSLIDATYSAQAIDDKMYNMLIKSMDEGGYEATAEEYKDTLSQMIAISEQGKAKGGDIILDKEEMKAYRTVTGINIGENQYYVASDNMLLTLQPDGVCIMYGEFTDTDEALGEFITSATYDGKYEKGEMIVTCTFEKMTTKLTFKTDMALKEYIAMYNEAYESGYLGKAVYDYYMALVTEDGFEDDTKQVFKFTLEPRTQTATVVEYPE